MNPKEQMIGKTFAHKANDSKPMIVGELIRFEKIHDYNMPVLEINGIEFLCAGIVFEYTDFIGKTLDLIPVESQWQFLKELKLSFYSLKTIQSQN